MQRNVDALFVCFLSPLPHGIRKDNGEVCLFTRDEPNMTSEQTIRFYKKLLAERGVKQVTEVLQHHKVFSTPGVTSLIQVIVLS